MTNEWEKELNKYNFNYKGYDCEILRHDTIGHLCGYVYLDKNHNYYKDPNNEYSLEVHGGITYSTDNKIGFDCAHSGDLLPYSHHFDWDSYKNVSHVMKEIKYLVKQLIKL